MSKTSGWMKKTLCKGMYIAWFYVNEVLEQEKVIYGEKNQNSGIWGWRSTGKGPKGAF